MSTESCRGGAQAERQLWHPLLDRGHKRRRKAGFLVCATKPSRRTAVEDAKSWRHGPRCGRGGDGCREASREVRRPRREWRLGPRRGGGNLPAREVLAVFSKPATYLPKPRTGSSSTWRHHREGFESKKETPPSDEIVYIFSVLPLRAF